MKSQSTQNLPHDFPQRVPIKIIGKEGVLDPTAIASVIYDRLGKQDQESWSSKKNGAYISYTFWIDLPDEHAEEPLRLAIQALPGVVMQL
ncbi:MAG: DUF493 domain-containing protein [Holophagaceae bacterium]|nr:DUF493 domain-containing protein [Holophagaceae bacterium]